jgi:catechol 2,3-dioxygenase-like lactoylglutathione lyase family enzyme
VAGQPVLNQLNLVVRDMDATLAFYRRLGFVFDVPPSAEHVPLPLPGGLLVEFDSTGFVPMWDSGWSGKTGGSTVLGLALPTRSAVDESYTELTGAGYAARQPPYDAFWGARYAIVEDPDGNPVGLMSPIVESRKTWPPTRPPLATRPDSS